jgi:hypothetical protein
LESGTGVGAQQPSAAIPFHLHQSLARQRFTLIPGDDCSIVSLKNVAVDPERCSVDNASNYTTAAAPDSWNQRLHVEPINKLDVANKLAHLSAQSRKGPKLVLPSNEQRWRQSRNRNLEVVHTPEFLPAASGQSSNYGVPDPEVRQGRATPARVVSKYVFSFEDHGTTMRGQPRRCRHPHDTSTDHDEVGYTHCK